MKNAEIFSSFVFTSRGQITVCSDWMKGLSMASLRMTSLRMATFHFVRINFWEHFNRKTIPALLPTE